MATTPVQNSVNVDSVANIEKRFRQLEATWESETRYLSDAHRIIEHPAFQEIIAMGEAVLPFMLRDLELEPRHWVWALPRITGVNPVSIEDAGNIRKMSAAWLTWAREHGYRW